MPDTLSNLTECPQGFLACCATSSLKPCQQALITLDLSDCTEPSLTSCPKGPKVSPKKNWWLWPNSQVARWENAGSRQNPPHPQMGIPKKQNGTRSHRRSFYDWQEEASIKRCFLFSGFEADVCSDRSLNWRCASGPWHVSNVGSPQESAFPSWVEGAEGKGPTSEFLNLG